MVHGAAPPAAQHARGMRVIHHHDAVVFLPKVAQLRQRRNIAVHRKNTVGNDQLLARKIRVLFEDALAVLHVLVLENLDRGSGKTRAIDDRSVIQLVGNNQIVFSQNCRHRSRVGRKSRLKHHAGFHLLERRDLLLQLQMQFHGASNRANGPRTRAVSLHRVQRGFAQRLVRGQPQVVVRSEVDHFSPVKNAHRLLLALEHA